MRIVVLSLSRRVHSAQSGLSCSRKGALRIVVSPALGMLPCAYSLPGMLGGGGENCLQTASRHAGGREEGRCLLVHLLLPSLREEMYAPCYVCWSVCPLVGVPPVYRGV